MLIPWGEMGTMSRAVLSSRAGVNWPTGASMLPIAHPQRWEYVVPILASAPEHEKDRKGDTPGSSQLSSFWERRGFQGSSI